MHASRALSKFDITFCAAFSFTVYTKQMSLPLVSLRCKWPKKEHCQKWTGPNERKSTNVARGVVRVSVCAWVVRAKKRCKSCQASRIRSIEQHRRNQIQHFGSLRNVTVKNRYNNYLHILFWNNSRISEVSMIQIAAKIHFVSKFLTNTLRDQLLPFADGLAI